MEMSSATEKKVVSVLIPLIPVSVVVVVVVVGVIVAMADKTKTVNMVSQKRAVQQNEAEAEVITVTENIKKKTKNINLKRVAKTLVEVIAVVEVAVGAVSNQTKIKKTESSQMTKEVIVTKLKGDAHLTKKKKMMNGTKKTHYMIFLTQ